MKPDRLQNHMKEIGGREHLFDRPGDLFPIRGAKPVRKCGGNLLRNRVEHFKIGFLQFGGKGHLLFCFAFGSGHWKRETSKSE